MTAFYYEIDDDKTTLKIDETKWEEIKYLNLKWRTQEETLEEIRNYFTSIGFKVEDDFSITSNYPGEEIIPENISLLKAAGPIFSPGTKIVLNVIFLKDELEDDWTEATVTSNGWLSD